MKKLLIPVIASILCLLLSACAPAEEYPFSPTALEKRFGDSMDEIVEDLGIDLETAEVAEHKEGATDITLRDVPISEGQPVTVMLSFNKDILDFVLYSSYDVEFIYDQAMALYDIYTEKYGEDITEPIWPAVKSNISRERFLDCASQPGFIARWKVQNKNISKSIYDSEDTKLAMRAESAVNTDGVNIANIYLSFIPLSQRP